MTDRDKLSKSFPQQALRQRTAPGGKSLTYVEGHTVIHRLNDSCDSWDFAIKDIHTSVIGRDRDGNEIILVRAHVALTIPEMGTREHIGVQSVRANAGEDLVKGAVTDALKKAATLFGVGLELYGPDYEAGEVEVAHRYATSQTDRPSREEMQKVERPRSTPIANGNGGGEITSWTEAWKLLRKMKITSEVEFATLTRHAIDKNLSPQEAIDLAASCLEDVAAAREI